MPTDKPRFTVVADDELLSAIKRFQTRHHYASQTEAVRELLSYGLELADLDQQPGAPKVFRGDELEIVNNYRASDPDTRLKVRMALLESASRGYEAPPLSNVHISMHDVIGLLQAFESAPPHIQNYVLELLKLHTPAGSPSASTLESIANDTDSAEKSG